jgi:trans-aconitate 2-methyltransferase
MSRDVWDPDQYAAFSDERSRAFFELVGQVRASAPGRVVDLGCGDGSLTATLTRRWPDATVEGIDSSPEMIAAAAKLAGPTGAEAKGAGHHTTAPQGSLRFAVGDVGEWRPDGPVDVIVSNAALQWVEGHQALLPAWVEGLSAGGWLAFQVPGNFHFPSHVILREVCGSPRWKDRLGGTLRSDPVSEPSEYLKILAGLGCRVNVWETTYLQILSGPDPVLEWVKGTALRPALTRLRDDEQARADFLEECRDQLRAAYPAESFGTVFPFRRIFAVARKAP